VRGAREFRKFTVFGGAEITHKLAPMQTGCEQLLDFGVAP